MTQPSNCPHCGKWSLGGKPCETTVCEGCGTIVCMSYGLRDGTCPVCKHGHLERWSKGFKPTCGVKGCKKEAFWFNVPRYKRLCKDHTDRGKIKVGGMLLSLTEYMAKMVTENKWRFERKQG